MEAEIKKYAKLGLVHHMLYPDSNIDPNYHAETLINLAHLETIDTFDCYLPYDTSLRDKLIPELNACNKEIVYALHAFPGKKISLGSLVPSERGLARLIVKDQIEMAASIGATGFIFVSGADIPEYRSDAKKYFEEFCMWLCEELAPYDICAMLEPFDRDVDKKYLLGPISECIELTENIQKKYDNFGIELDFAHLPLMYENTRNAVFACAQFLKRVHLGNCVLKDKKHPLFGDQHPPIGLEGGEIGTPELTEILNILWDSGYLSCERKMSLVFEMTPFPGKTPEFTWQDTLFRLKTAWENTRFY